MAFRLYAAVGQAMASYIAQRHFDIVHLHENRAGAKIEITRSFVESEHGPCSEPGDRQIRKR